MIVNPGFRVQARTYLPINDDLLPLHSARLARARSWHECYHNVKYPKSFEAALHALLHVRYRVRQSLRIVTVISEH